MDWLVLEDTQLAGVNLAAAAVLSDVTNNVDALLGAGVPMIPYRPNVHDPVVRSYRSLKRSNPNTSLLALFAVLGIGAGPGRTLRDLSLVVDGRYGDDRNDGTPSRPVRTLAGLSGLIPTFVDHDLDVQIMDAGSPYAFANLGHHVGRGMVVLRADAFTEVLGETAAAAGTTAVQIVTAGGLVADAYKHKTIEMLTGAAAGCRRRIASNDATTIVPVFGFTDSANAAVVPAVGDTFRIIDPKVEISVPGVSLASGQHSRTRARLFSGLNPQRVEPTSGAVSGVTANLAQGGGLQLIGLKFSPDGAGGVYFLELGAETCVAVLGCDFAGGVNPVADLGALILSGGDDPALGAANMLAVQALALGLIDASARWAGWGFAAIGGGLPYLQSLVGYLNFECAAGTAGLQTASAQWLLFGGAVINTVAGGTAWNVQNSRIRIAPMGTTALVKMRIESNGNSNDDPVILVFAGGLLELANCAIANQGTGMGLIAYGNGAGSGRTPGRIGFNGGTTTIQASRYGLCAANGGRIDTRNTITFSGPPTAECAVIKGALTAAANNTSTFAALATSGNSLQCTGADAGNGTIIAF